MDRKGRTDAVAPTLTRHYPIGLLPFGFCQDQGFWNPSFSPGGTEDPNYLSIYHGNRCHACKPLAGDRKEVADAAGEWDVLMSKYTDILHIMKTLL